MNKIVTSERETEIREAPYCAYTCASGVSDLLALLDAERAAHTETQAELEAWIDQGLTVVNSHYAWRTAYWEMRDALESYPCDCRSYKEDDGRVETSLCLRCETLGCVPPGERP